MNRSKLYIPRLKGAQYSRMTSRGGAHMPWCSPFLPPMHNAHFMYIFLVINKGLYIAPKKQEILCSLGLYIARNMYMGTHVTQIEGYTSTAAVPYAITYYATDNYVSTCLWLHNNECSKVQNPRRMRVRESFKAHALDL